MATYNEMEQMQAFARIDGVLLALLWTASFACVIGNFLYPVLGMGAFIVGAGSLVFAAMRLKKFRDEARDGFISFRRALGYSILQYLYASLLFAAVQYIYFQFLDHGFLMTQYTTVMKSKEFLDMMKIYGYSAEDLKFIMQNIEALKPIEIALQFFTTNVIMGICISIPVAIIMKKTPRNRKFYNRKP